MNEEETYPREGYMLVVEPVIGLLRVFMTGVSAWVMMEILKTDHGRAMMQQLPGLIKTYCAGFFN